MSTWKSAADTGENGDSDRVSPVAPDKTEPPKASDVAVVSLEIDLEPEGGGDPYNSTGKHMVEQIRKYED